MRNHVADEQRRRRSTTLSPSEVAIADVKHWKEENRSAIEAQNAWVDKHGLPLAEHRMF